MYCNTVIQKVTTLHTCLRWSTFQSISRHFVLELLWHMNCAGQNCPLSLHWGVFERRAIQANQWTFPGQVHWHLWPCESVLGNTPRLNSSAVLQWNPLQRGSCHDQANRGQQSEPISRGKICREHTDVSTNVLQPSLSHKSTDTCNHLPRLDHCYSSRSLQDLSAECWKMQRLKPKIEITSSYLIYIYIYKIIIYKLSHKIIAMSQSLVIVRVS